MTNEQFYIIFVILQILHSQEEIYTGFYKKWPVFKMSKKFFVTFEILFSIFIIIPIFLKSFPYRVQWMYFFNLLMFANGVQHLVWSKFGKEYVPGLVTGIIFIALFLYYYFRFLVH